MRVTVAKADQPTASGKIYPRAVLQTVLEETSRREAIWVSDSLGVIEADIVTGMSIDRIVARADNWEWSGDDLTAEIVTLDGSEVDASLTYHIFGLGEFGSQMGVVDCFELLGVMSYPHDVYSCPDA